MRWFPFKGFAIPFYFFAPANGPYFTSEHELLGHSLALEAWFYNVKYFRDIINERNIQSLYLAFELKQSSDDLTRFARTYAVTGDPRYENYFRKTIAIRDGKQAHPKNFTPFYWDYVAAGKIKLDQDGEI